MTQTAHTTMTAVPLDHVKPAEGINPRANGTAGDAFDELVKSIKAHGVLQPVLVRPIAGPNKNGPRYDLVAGNRRWHAAKKAGLTEIPVYVRHDLAVGSTGTRVAAIVENVQRSDLSPIEEARAVATLAETVTGKGSKAKAVAKMLGKSDDWVQKRMNLLDLPAGVQTAFETGAVRLHAAPLLGRLAKAHPTLAEKAVEVVTSSEGDWAAGDLERPDAVRDLIDEAIYDMNHADGVVPVLEIGRHRYTLDELPITHKQRAALAEKWGKVDEYTQKQGIHLGSHRDAFDALGVLTEIGERWYALQFVSDAPAIADRFDLALDDVLKTNRDHGPRQAAKSPQKGGGAAGGGTQTDDAEKQKAAKKAASQARYDATVEARGRNLDVGTLTAEVFKRPKVDVDTARQIVRWAIAGVRGSWNDLPGAGLRLCDPRWHELTEQKNGRTRVAYADSHKVHEWIEAEIDRAKTPAEVFGVFLRAVVCADLADQEQLPQSHRAAWDLGYHDNKARKIAARFKAIPATVSKHLAAKSKKGGRS